MANRTKNPEIKKVQFMLSITKNIKDKVREQSDIEDKSMSEYVEEAIKEKLYANK